MLTAFVLAEKQPVLNLRDLSITFTCDSSDVDVDKYLPLIKAYCDTRCVKYFFGVERGGVLQQKHFQGVVRVMVTAAQVFTKRFRTALYSNEADNVGHTILSRELKGTGLHTFQGMVGYCCDDSGLLHWNSISKDVTEEDTEAGKELYMHYGSSEEMKNCVILNSHNIFHRAAVFQKYRSNHPLGSCFLNILVEMHNSGKYIPDAKWLIPAAGKGMVYKKAQSAWKMYLQPKEVTRQDVVQVYFSEAETLREEGVEFVHESPSTYRRAAPNELGGANRGPSFYDTLQAAAP